MASSSEENDYKAMLYNILDYNSTTSTYILYVNKTHRVSKKNEI